MTIISLGRLAPEKPLRAEILSREGLGEHARFLADQHRLSKSSRGTPKLYYRFEENDKLLHKTYLELLRKSQSDKPLSFRADWLLDNYHIIKEQILDIRRNFPKGYYRSLPKLAEGDYARYPRVYHLALEIVSHTDAAIDNELLTTYIDAYQLRVPLLSGELWAVPIMLRFALIENLRRLALAILENKERQTLADELVAEIIGSEDRSSTDMLLILASKLRDYPDFLNTGALSLIRQLREKGPKSALTLQWIEERLKEQGHDPEVMARTEHHLQATNLISIGNTVASLQKVKTMDWKQWFESVSIVHKALLTDPAQSYQKCDFATRDSYRKSIEFFSRELKVSETEIANEAIKLARSLTDNGSKGHQSENSTLRYSHVGYYLVDKGIKLFKEKINYREKFVARVRRVVKQQSLFFYLGTISVLTFAMIWQVLDFAYAVGGRLDHAILIALLFCVPLSDLASNIVQWVVTRCTWPRSLPKLDFESAIPKTSRSIIALQVIFKDKQAVTKTIEGLEVTYLANDDPNMFLALLADLPDANTEHQSEDREIIEHAVNLINKLNQRHFANSEGRFFLLFRRRLWNPSEGIYMGWERKRGKISEFNRLVLGDENTTLDILVGEKEQLRTIKYVITLDSDSSLPRGVGVKLVGAIAHPLNHPVFDVNSNVVIEGYAIIQPRVGVVLQSAQASRFADIFSGYVGLDPYTQMVSDVYQDLFSEGSYVGKGIYEIKAFERALGNRVPENALLSHDLFEGCFSRVALATDIEIFDNFPSSYQAYAKRLHRWVRGDWQLFSWIFNKIPDAQGELYLSPISILNRWKLIDNLRRSLVAPSIFIFLILAFTVLPGSPLPWILLVVFVITFPVYARIANALILPPLEISVSGYARGVGRDLLKQSIQAIITISFLPYQAYLMSHAALISLYRILISHRHLLEWEVSDDLEKRLGNDLRSIFLQMLPAICLTLLVTILVIITAPTHLFYAAPILFLWAFSPALVSWLSRSALPEKSNLSNDDKNYLYTVAWETWSYFDELMTQEHNYLVPDNIQIAPRRVVAERTSPTNISLSILSVISAYDMGFLTLAAMVEKLSNTYLALSKLERFHGHFFNWHQTKTLTTLSPRYISFVDSGNFVGHLIAARTALMEFSNAPLISIKLSEHIRRELLRLTSGQPKGNKKNFCHSIEELVFVFSQPILNIKGLLNAIGALSKFVESVDSIADLTLCVEERKISSLQRLLLEFKQVIQIGNFINWYPDFEENLPAAQAIFVEFSESFSQRFNNILTKIEQEFPSLQWLKEVYAELGDLILDLENSKLERSTEVRKCLSKLVETMNVGIVPFEVLLEDLNLLTVQTTTMIEEVDFSFLYDKDKGLFAIGYDVENGQKDNSFYDLLATEARLGSFVAIAMGGAPQKHWFYLGRSLVNSAGGPALISWSATMFEYLMPLLVMHDFPGTVLSRTYQAVVKTQRQYAQSHKIPWGISESGYSRMNFENIYQYKAFGVPKLGLKRGLADDLVVSPYSTFLALIIDPRAAVENLKELEKQKLRGKYGFYEAIDYTQERLGSDENSHIVQAFFSHHHGMTIVAVNNLLQNGVMQNRFHADPWVRSAALLLHERFPDPMPALVAKDSEIDFAKNREQDLRMPKTELLTTPHTFYPQTRILSNGHYTVLVDNSGSGLSIFDRDIALTRFREDAISGQYGLYIFVRDLDDGKLWSVAYQPTRVEPDSYEVIFSPNKVEFKRRDFGILLHTEITVSPEDNVELRKVTITNLSGRKRNLELTSYGEVALANARGDLMHPAFSKMFVESEYNEDFESLIFSRRPRSKNEERLYMMHMLTTKTCWEPTQFESSRMNFLGRGNNIGAPKVFSSFQKLSGTTGEVLDPIFSLRARIEIEEGRNESVVFTSGFARTHQEITQLSQRYHDAHSITRAFEMAWSNSNLELRNDQFSIRQIHTFQRLVTALFYNVDKVRGERTSLLNNKLTQSALWRFGISGDLPLVLLRFEDSSDMKLAQELLLAHQYIRMRGVSFDLVIINESQGGYFQTLQEELEFMTRSGSSENLVDKKGGIYLRTRTQLSDLEIGLLETVARAVFIGSKGSLSSQLKLEDKTTDIPARGRGLVVPTRLPEYPDTRRPKSESQFFNGIGGFVNNGRSYQIEIRNGILPPLPWSNVIANPSFGFLVTESGGGYTWSENSRENKITPWCNDPVSDASGEVLYLRDLNSGALWSPTPKPISSNSSYRVTHSFGQSQFLSEQYGIKSELVISGSSSRKVKWWHLLLKNETEVERKLEIFLYVDWVLGVSREESYRYLVTNFDRENDFLHVTNNYNNEFAGRLVSIGSNLKIKSYTTSRHEFIGRHRSMDFPQVFESTSANTFASFLTNPRQQRVDLKQKVGTGFDACGVIKVELTLAPREEREVLFYLSEAGSLEEARRDVTKFRSLDFRSGELTKGDEQLQSLIRAVEIRTPDSAFDILMNGWLLYQTLYCRLYARSAFYQSGGAFGFRDQLQDVMALLYMRSDLAKDQILLHASRQFPEGDVQHWWHEPTGRGVRTQISDDYLWLPYVVSQYLEVTGDQALLDEQVPFIDGEKLSLHQHDSYFAPQRLSKTASVYEHCILALDHALVFGSHGLPLMGGGDWNDGMNEVGIEGKGESVWLAWFLSDCLEKFSKIANDKKDHESSAKYAEKAKELISAIDQNAWDGDWYRRAYFDDGTPLGSKENQECKIDSLSQTWAVIVGKGDAERRKKAMGSLRRELIKKEEKIICLLTPPFHNSELEPGYIKGYLSGIRENGGQYTHAASWVIMATALEGRGNEAFELFSMINPINHTSDSKGVQKYQGEPYVLAGDVYSNAAHSGRAGWSWYTGAAGWIYRVGLEYILGFVIKGESFTVNPVVPSTWKEFSISYLRQNIKYDIKISNPDGVEKGVRSIALDGKIITGSNISFIKASDISEGNVAVRVVQIHVVMG